MGKLNFRYRVNSMRLPGWDYGRDGSYFITICTKRMRLFFGEVVDGKMNLSYIGVLADKFWHEIRHHSKNVDLGPFVVMPNHIHGILILEGNDAYTMGYMDGTKPGERRRQNQGRNTVSSIIGSYKSAVSKHAHLSGYVFAWQSRFWDHIIRNDDAYTRIANYIINNPKKWHDDRFYTP
jgi:putative transposase